MESFRARGVLSGGMTTDGHERLHDPFRAKRERYGAPLVGSVLFHALVLVFLIADFGGAADWQDQEGAGGAGPVGGGGGGGARQIGYIALPAYRPPQPPPQEEARPPRPEEIIIPQAQLQDVQIVERFDIPRESTAVDVGRVLGRGAGEGGGPGAGPGSGGGIGSGQGTGIGTGVGPGTGGGEGEIYLPHPRMFGLPPEPRPSSVKGKEYEVHFWVSATGDVLRVAIRPDIRDAAYRSRLVDYLHDWRFNPGVRRDGTPVPAEVTVLLTL